MKAYGRLEMQIHLFLTSALERGEWSVSFSVRFTARGKILLYPVNVSKQIIVPAGNGKPIPFSSIR